MFLGSGAGTAADAFVYDRGFRLLRETMYAAPFADSVRDWNPDVLYGAAWDRAMGSDDVRVPLIHAQEFVKNMKDAGGNVEMVVYTGEAHGFNKDVNVLDFYSRLEKFFAKYIGDK